MGHEQEWLNSCVDRQLIELNVKTLKGTSSSEYLLYSDELTRRNNGRLSNSILKRYEHVEEGGWWCSGIDVMTGSSDLWGCFKPDKPRFNHDKNRIIRYEHPPKTPTGIFALRVPLHLWRRIAERYNIEFRLEMVDKSQSDFGFWQWVIDNKSIPLCITEGAKKAGALLTAGYVAVALPGINNGYRTPKDEIGNRIGKSYLIPQLHKLVARGRNIYIVFDQDDKPNTVKAVNKAIKKLGFLMNSLKCQVKVITWDLKYGKGVDDFLLNSGNDSFNECYNKALPIETWKAKELNHLTLDSNLEINTPYIPNLSIPETEKLVAIKSGIGTGKTKFLSKIVQKAIAKKQKILVIGHRIKLVQQLCQRFGLSYITEYQDNSKRHYGYGLCIDSLHEKSQANFNPNDWQDALIIIDEVEQVLWHGLNSDTCSNNRVSILRCLKSLMQSVMNGKGRLFVADADLSNISVEYLITLSGYPVKPYIVRNNWIPKSSSTWKAYNYIENTPKKFLKDLVEHIQKGGKPYICLSAQKLTSKWGTQTLELYLQQQFPEAKILRIDSESLIDPNHSAYKCIDHLDSILTKYDVVITSPVLETGISIDVKGHFSSVWCLAQGIQNPTSVIQSLGRVRENIPRYLWLASYGFNRVGNGSVSIPGLLTSGHRLTNLNIRFLQQSDLESLEDLDIGFQGESLLSWGKMAVRMNAKMITYRETIISFIQQANHKVEFSNENKNSRTKKYQNNKSYFSLEKNSLIETIEEIRENNYRLESENISQAEDLTQEEYKTLKRSLVKTATEQRKLRKYNLKLLYSIPVTPELVMLDNNGWYQKLRIHYFLTKGRIHLAERDSKIAQKMIGQGEGSIFLPDFNSSQLGATIGILEVLGIHTLLNDINRKIINIDPDLVKMSHLAISNKRDIKSIMKVGIANNASPITIIRKLLDKIGFSLNSCGSQKIGKKRFRIYQVVPPNDNREAVFEKWLLKDQKLSGNSEWWFEECYLFKQQYEVKEQSFNHIQLSLNFT